VSNAAAQTKEEIIRYIDEKNDLLWHMRGIPTFDVRSLSEDILAKSKELNYKLGIGRCLMNRAMGAFILDNNSTLAFEILNESIENFKEINAKKWIANTHATLGIIHNTIGNSESALYNGLRALDYYDSNPQDLNDRVMLYYILGTIYKDLKKYEDAKNFYLKGVDQAGTDKGNWGGRIFTGLANVFAALGNYEEALNYSFIALEQMQTEGNHIGISRAISDIGIIYKKQKKYPEALQYLEEGLAIRLKHNFKQFVISSQIEIAETLCEINRYNEALAHLAGAESIAIEINQLPKLAKIYQAISEVYKLQEDYKASLLYAEKLIILNDKIFKTETETRIKNLQNSLVKEKEDEIERLRNVELKNAYSLISEKNKEITDSINYARIIQQGIFPSSIELNDCLKDHFVLYKPKDIVSGDFYWCKKVPMNDNTIDVTVVAAADCTGHGVPGAFMSMLGSTLLNQTVKSGEVTGPGEALNYLNKELPKNLKSQDHLTSIKDGMDIVLCGIEFNSRKLIYAGANNPLWIIRNKELIELKADKQAITASEEAEKRPFENKHFDLQKNDILYLFTDGFADQFGGPKGKKFKYSSLAKILIEINHLSMVEQKSELEKVFENWKGGLEQVDDVLVIGIRI